MQRTLTSVAILGIFCLSSGRPNDPDFRFYLETTSPASTGNPASSGFTHALESSFGSQIGQGMMRRQGVTLLGVHKWTTAPSHDYIRCRVKVTEVQRSYDYTIWLTVVRLVPQRLGAKPIPAAVFSERIDGNTVSLTGFSAIGARFSAELGMRLRSGLLDPPKAEVTKKNSSSQARTLAVPSGQGRVSKGYRGLIEFMASTTVLSQPKKGAKVLARVKEGQRLSLVPGFMNENWAKVRLSSGREGYVLRSEFMIVD